MPTMPGTRPTGSRRTTRRRWAALLTALAASLSWGAVNAPAAHAASYYKCSFTSASTSVKIGGTVSISVRYTNLNPYASSAWTEVNTNPVVSIISSGKVVAEMTPGGSYWVGPYSSVTLKFKRGTAKLSAGKTYTLKAEMYYAEKGNTTSLMPGTPCSAKLKVT